MHRRFYHPANPTRLDYQCDHLNDRSLTSLSIEDPTSGTITTTASSSEATAVLDSGTAVTIVPPDIAKYLIDFAGAVLSDEYGYLLACNDSSYTGTLNHGFGGSGGAIIKVPFSELVIPTAGSAGNPLTFTDGTPACTFGVQPSLKGNRSSSVTPSFALPTSSTTLTTNKSASRLPSSTPQAPLSRKSLRVMPAFGVLQASLRMSRQPKPPRSFRIQALTLRNRVLCSPLGQAMRVSCLGRPFPNGVHG